MNTVLYIITLIIVVLIELQVNKNNNFIISTYKNPIFKLIFLFSIYLYGNYDINFTLLIAMFYVYIGQKIQEKELLNIIL